jgi:hypothetical protein
MITCLGDLDAAVTWMMLSRPSSTSHPKVKFLSLFALGYIAAMLCSSVLCCPRLVLVMHYTFVYLW